MSSRRPFLLFLLLATLLMALFVADSLAANDQDLVPPLDDSFIHFQYATRLVAGEPFAYEVGGGYTSGGTSLLWPFLLAPGALLGFRGQTLYLWALLLAVPATAGTAWYTWRWMSRLSDERTGFWAALATLLCGPLLWGAFSGMEIPIFACAIAASLEAVSRPRLDASLLWLALLSGIRPEGMLMAGMISLYALWRWRKEGGRFPAEILLSSVGTLQPLLNRYYTGMFVSSSVLAKQNPRMPSVHEWSFPSLVWDNLIWGIYADHFFGAVGPVYLLLFLGGIAWFLRRERLGMLVGACWLLPVLIMALTLPTPANHGRYLMPGLVLFVPVMMLAVTRLEERLQSGEWLRGGIALSFIPQTFQWAWLMSLNAGDIHTQHASAAQWVREHTEAATRIAVTDAGFVPVLAGRPILDLEGITDAHVLPYALAGEGSLLGLLKKERPPYVIAFPNWNPGLFLSDAVEILWTTQIERRTISGGSAMLIAKVLWDVLEKAEQPPQLDPGEGVRDMVDVSDLDDEAAHDYDYRKNPPFSGRNNTIVTGRYPDGTRIVDNARRHYDTEHFRFRNAQGATRIVARLGAISGEVRLRMKLGDQTGQLILPKVPEGTWTNLSFAIPAPQGTDLEVSLEAESEALGIQGGWQVARWWLIGPALP